MQNRVLIITGPTASGKTQLSELLISELNGQIINADVGQFYKPLSIGTAKPDLKSVSYPNHLFDVINTPQDLSVAQYRQLVEAVINNSFKQNKTPIIVGGSLFYIKSLFFPPSMLECSEKLATDVDLDNLSDLQAREMLQKIDPERFAQIHANDMYRIRRALDIWKMTGQKPSTYKPQFKPLFDVLIVYVCPSINILNQRIRQRTEQMIKVDGWLDEARSLIGTDWEPFASSKGLIGYPEIFQWLKRDNPCTLDDLIETIEIKTRQYAKRQRTFWQSFKKQLEEEISNNHKNEFDIKILEVSTVGVDVKNQILNIFNNVK